MRKFCFILVLVLTCSSIIFSIEVGGHLIEDTIWSPENNPYIVTETLFVDSDITLSILPGTIVKISGASCTSWQEYSQNFWLQNGVSVAKMFWVEGKIIAEGTEQDSITFTKLQNDQDYCWGTIYITEHADLSHFEYCKFEYTAGIGIHLSRVASGAISIYNGSGIIRNCLIINNTSSIITQYNDINSLEISGNIILKGSNLNNFATNMRIFGFSTGSVLGNKLALIVGNSFESSVLSFNSVNFVDNDISESTIFIANNNYITNIYDNEFMDCQTAIHGGNENDSIYIKKNQFIGGYEGIAIDDAYVEISDNYFEECDAYTEYATGKVYNNIMNNGEAWTPGEVEVFNNICYNSDGYGLKAGYNPYCINNISINNEFDIWSATNLYENNIFILNEELTQHSINGDPVFRNCIIDFSLDPPLIDGGGNIVVDSLQAQSIFVDIENGDFHLVPGSIAIDAGFDTLGYYYPFDLDYNHRVWDGNNDGISIIDIGPYEFGAPAFGGIEGYTYNPTTGDPVDYVLLKINNQPGEFTCTDSIGNFEYKLPAGIYNVYAERVFYEDIIEYQIEVIDGEFTQISIPMFEIVDVDENEIVSAHNDFNLMNYPNPFNPETTISFSIQSDINVELSIFNIKGQKIKTLINEQMQKGKHNAIWSGVDENNKPVSSGIYLYKIKAGKQESVNRMLLLK